MSDISVASADTTPPRDDRIDVVVPLRSEFGATLRTVAASLGADAGFSVDEIDDLRLALSEIFAVLVEGAPAASRLSVSFTVDTGEVEAVVGVDGGTDGIELDDLARGILASVLDEFESTAGGMRLLKRAFETAADGATAR